VGSQSNVRFSYIAGFLDGDGSLMLQIKQRPKTKSGYRFMATICFYQDTRHESGLVWIQKVLKIGYLSRRKDGITELRINGFTQVNEILIKIYPYIQFKKIQAEALIEATNILKDKNVNQLCEAELERIVKLIILLRKHNYKSSYRKSLVSIRKTLGLTP